MRVSKNTVMAYWWGRVIPDELKHLRSLSSLSQTDVVDLHCLMQYRLLCEKDGVQLFWD